jgi:hypothetical protein
LALFFAFALLPAIASNDVVSVHVSGSVSEVPLRAAKEIRALNGAGALAGAPEVAGLCALAGAAAGAATSLLFTGGPRRQNPRDPRA